jgi:hypothetical protein
MRDESYLPPLRDPYHLNGTLVPDGYARAEFLLWSEVEAQYHRLRPSRELARVPNQRLGKVEARYLIQFPVIMSGAELISWLTEQFHLVAGRWGLDIEEEDDTWYLYALEPNQEKVIRRSLPHIRLMTISFRPNPSKSDTP